MSMEQGYYENFRADLPLVNLNNKLEESLSFLCVYSCCWNLLFCSNHFYLLCCIHCTKRIL